MGPFETFSSIRFIVSPINNFLAHTFSKGRESEQREEEKGCVEVVRWCRNSYTESFRGVAGGVEKKERGVGGRLDWTT